MPGRFVFDRGALSKIQINNIKKLMELNGRGCFRLVGRALLNCFQPIIYENQHKKWRRELVVKEMRCNFADSKLLQIWCDVAELDFKRIRKAIIKANTYD